jgi:hypothetical protein
VIGTAVSCLVQGKESHPFPDDHSVQVETMLFPGFLPIKLNVGIHHLVNVAFRRDLHLPILIPRERLSKMKINRTGSLQFEVILLLKSIREWFRVQHSETEVVDIRCHILIQIANESHPDIRFCLARWEAFIVETIGKAFMPM